MTPQWPCLGHLLLGPVTVAGPRRLLTGLPLTTDPCEQGRSYIAPDARNPRKKREAARRPPLATSTGKESYFFLDFFALHFCGVADALKTSPL
jgi:hypothetical protein